MYIYPFVTNSFVSLLGLGLGGSYPGTDGGMSGEEKEGSYLLVQIRTCKRFNPNFLTRKQIVRHLHAQA